jgi:hypothetical protein
MIEENGEVIVLHEAFKVAMLELWLASHSGNEATDC